MPLLHWILQGVSMYQPYSPKHDCSTIPDTLATASTVLLYAHGIFIIIFFIVHGEDSAIRFSQPKYLVAIVIGSIIGISTICPLPKQTLMNLLIRCRIIFEKKNSQRLISNNVRQRTEPWLLAFGSDSFQFNLFIVQATFYDQSCN
jgi:hypothetical protein